MAYYKDMREYVKVLEEKGKLVRIKRTINKDTELHPLVRWQFRGLPEEERMAFYFENVVDVKGRKFDIPVLVACHAASRQVYAIGMMCEPGEIMEKWAQAELHAIPPKRVETGSIYEEIHKGDKLMEHGCLEEFPIPISTPGFDNAPYLTAANWVTMDPDTGIRNVGNYRSMVKSPTRLGVCAMSTQHFREHWDRARAKGIPLEAAVVIGASPNLGYVATSKVPYGKDEYAVAGGIAGAPLEVVKCQTVDIEVPANAEIVIEGIVPTDYQEREAPFGEYTGYMGMESINPVMNITCIMHRKKPIYNAFLSQFPPSESSKLRSIGYEAVTYKFLKHDCNIPGITAVAYHESSGGAMYVVIAMRKTHPSQVWQALNGACALIPNSGKIYIVVDEDIDPWDPDSVNWALSFRMQPHRDTRITMGKVSGLDPSSTPLTEKERRYPGVHGCSALLIDATRKWAYAPTSLPKKEFMEAAKKIWEEEGLPKLRIKVPWHGYDLGHWTEENAEEALLALKGEHYKTGEKLAKRRIPSITPGQVKSDD
ncbi:MAG: UbiD family decarboxylase [Dehalococcoidia bacterium]|nr:UbiD family decarboxylase [Dehalococcoidia bacterium]